MAKIIEFYVPTNLQKRVNPQSDSRNEPHPFGGTAGGGDSGATGAEKKNKPQGGHGAYGVPWYSLSRHSEHSQVGRPQGCRPLRSVAPFASVRSRPQRPKSKPAPLRIHGSRKLAALGSANLGQPHPFGGTAGGGDSGATGAEKKNKPQGGHGAYGVPWYSLSRHSEHSQVGRPQGCRPLRSVAPFASVRSRPQRPNMIRRQVL